MSCKSAAKRAKKLDLFCWKCHMSDTNIGCNGCERSFHNKCISVVKNLQELSSNWKCKECTDREQSPTSALDGIKLQQMMLCSVKMISKSADYYFKSDKCFADKKVAINTNLIINAINLNVIENKVNNFQYKTFREMIVDFKWILHNAIIARLESGLLENAKFLLSKAKSELQDFEECLYCFINYYKTCKSQYYSWFSRPCPQKHCLVWAKVRGHPFWPSKVIKPNQQNSSVLVRFFGTHQKSWVKEKDCYLLSAKSPQELRGKGLKMAKLFDASIEELRHHIKYLNEEYPNWFRYWPLRTPFCMKDFFSSYNMAKQNQLNVSANEKIQNQSQPKVEKAITNPSKLTFIEQKERKGDPLEITYFSSVSSEKCDKFPNDIEIIEFKSKTIEFNTKSNIIPEKRVKCYNEVKRQVKVQSGEIGIVSDTQSRGLSEWKPSVIVNDVNECQTQPNVNPTDDRYVRLKSDYVIKNDNSLKANKLVQKWRQRVSYVEKKIKRTDSSYQKRLVEMQRKSDFELEEIRRSLEEDKQRAIVEECNKLKAIYSQRLTEQKKKFETTVTELRVKHDLEIKSLEQKWIQELNECKTKIWCFNCQNEANLYCCSHTYYCSTDCQQRHWDSHKKICVQKIV